MLTNILNCLLVLLPNQKIKLMMVYPNIKISRINKLRNLLLNWFNFIQAAVISN